METKRAKPGRPSKQLPKHLEEIDPQFGESVMTSDDTVQVDQGHLKTVKNPTSQSTSEYYINKEWKEPTTPLIS